MSPDSRLHHMIIPITTITKRDDAIFGRLYIPHDTCQEPALNHGNSTQQHLAMVAEWNIAIFN